MATRGLATREASKPKAEPAWKPALKPRAPGAIHALPSFLSSAGNIAIQRLAAGAAQVRRPPIDCRSWLIGTLDSHERSAHRARRAAFARPAPRRCDACLLRTPLRQRLRRYPRAH